MNGACDGGCGCSSSTCNSIVYSIYRIAAAVDAVVI